LVPLPDDIIPIMTPLYTGRGDDGTTVLPGQGRIPKCDPQIEMLGILDETNSFLGMARAQTHLDLTKGILLHIQRDFYRVMADLAHTQSHEPVCGRISTTDVEWVESQLLMIENSIVSTHEFIVPGDSVQAAAMDIARTAVRRSERQISALLKSNGSINSQILRYLNRLSSLCFALELLENQSAGFDHPTSAENFS
jgi:cob(I)alamin adenosyltransferase